MCGLTGVILETKERTPRELSRIAIVFTKLLVLNQYRGHHATGAAVIKNDGTYHIHKQPGTAADFIMTSEYRKVLNTLDSDTTCIIGHTRWKTRGSEFDNRNNQPVVTSRTITTHNGTITNADALFSGYRLTRKTEVDSELIGRLADRFSDDDSFLRAASEIEGTMSSVFVRLHDPQTINVIKGNKPLTLWYHSGLRAIFYSSEKWPLEKVFARSRLMAELEIAPFTISHFNASDLLGFRQSALRFTSTERTIQTWTKQAW